MATHKIVRNHRKALVLPMPPGGPGKGPGPAAGGEVGPTRPGKAEPERVDERLVDLAVAHLRKLVVAGQVETMIAVGSYVIEHFYGGVEQAKSRRPDKPATLARLVERAEEFGMKPANLRFVVPLTLAARELGAPLATRLGVSRLRTLLPVKDVTQRKLLAETAIASNFTVDRLEQRVRQIAAPQPGGRPATPGILLLMTRVERVVEAAREPAHLRRGLEKVSPAEARRGLQRLSRLQADLERVKKLLQRAAQG